MPWRYSGSKKRLIKYLPAPPLRTATIVEPFAGSAAYGMHYKPESLVLAEANTDVRELWEWLATTATEEELKELEAKKPTEKVDIRSLELPKPQETLMRLSISGAYVGQLSSFIAYPQHSFNLSGVAEALHYIRRSVRIAADFRETAGLNALYFIDPPYLGTQGNYHDKSKKHDMTGDVSAEDLKAFISGIKSPVLFTYGEGAPELFPEFDWKLAVMRKVPVLRGGGTRDRREWYCQLNW